MTQNERIKAVSDLILELDEVLLRAASRLAELRDPTIIALPVGSLATKRPLLESGTYCVCWRRRRCYLRCSTSYRLFARLLKRTDRFVSYDSLLADVWENRVVTPQTVRSAVRLLKSKLVDAGMGYLASSIRGESQQYGLFLEHRMR